MAQDHYHPAQIAAWRRMTSAEKWRLASEATTMVMDAARRRIARNHPDWDEAAIDRETARFIARART